ncbi:MAG: ATP-binding protein [Candidatus Hermodarchaeota archaeon]|nr:ATP-binding protein [Candidatus Hermodarchaeota archaeon]
MKELVILSGKGGTGKTSVTAALTTLTHAVVADCDVDAPNLHLLLNPTIQKSEEFIASKLATINPELCVECGACELACRFGAVKPDYTIDPIMCEGCGVCQVTCPYNAIQMHDRLSGYIYSSTTAYGPMAHAELLAGESNSGKLVTKVRELARRIAETEEHSLLLVDGPPGIACATIASITGATTGLIVAEPTVPAIHDLERVVQLLNHFKIPALVLINKSDLNTKKSQEIERYCMEQAIPVVGQVPYDTIMYEAVVAGQPIIEFAPNHRISTALKESWTIIEDLLSKQG